MCVWEDAHFSSKEDTLDKRARIHSQVYSHSLSHSHSHSGWRPLCSLLFPRTLNHGIARTILHIQSNHTCLVTKGKTEPRKGVGEYHFLAKTWRRGKGTNK